MNLQTLILELAPRHSARDRVPVIGEGSHPSVIAFDSGGMLVWAGASEHTIYRDPCVNHAFRAWHDAAHIAGGFGFTLEGERAACEYQIAEALRRYPRIAPRVLGLIRAEVIGQAEYYATHGEFPIDQEAFIREYLK